MRVVVTGATGAIGHAFLEKCISQGDEVYVICRPFSKRAGTLDRYAKSIHVVEADLEEPGQVKDIIGKRCDALYHLAWEGTTGESRNDFILQSRNINYTLNAVELAAQLQCSVFIGAGSQAEYGRKYEKLNEQTPVNPETGYGAAKLSAGIMSRLLCHEYGIKHIWMRILSVYGPYDSESSMVMSALMKMLAGRKTEFTKGEQIWDYIYSKDVAEIMYRLWKQGTDGKVYCVGSGTAKPLKEYIEIMRQIVKPVKEPDMGAIPYTEKTIMFLQADTTEIEKDLQYRCRYSFEQGIRETAQWLLSMGERQ